MAQLKELKKIKKIYGEEFSHLCRKLFPQILEHEGVLLRILQNTFSRNSKSLYEDIVENQIEYEFKSLICNIFNKEILKVKKYENGLDLMEEDKLEFEKDIRSPYEILDEAGYVLYECMTEEDIQSFRKYYKPEELLCTINDGDRLSLRVCFWAVKKNVDDIKRENFKEPRKGDEYSTSVLAIQFDKEPTTSVDIISRYNHTVPNPNCTLNNNLDNLADGLTESFSKLLMERGYKLNKKEDVNFTLPGYTIAADGKYYKYNYEINGTYYCPGNIVIENDKAREIGNPEEVILCDYFKIDLKNKSVECLVKDEEQRDSFADDLKDIIKIEVTKDKEKERKYVNIFKEGRSTLIIIELNKDNQIVSYTNDELKELGDNFLLYNKTLSELNLSNLKKVGDNFLYYNSKLTRLNMPEVQTIGDNFLCSNEDILSLELPKVREIGNNFMPLNYIMDEIQLPEVKSIGCKFLVNSLRLAKLELPKIETVGDDFLYSIKELSKISMPELKEVGERFLYNNKELSRLDLPKLQVIGEFFLNSNQKINEVHLPEARIIKAFFLGGNEALKKLELPKAEYIYDSFLYSNSSLMALNIPNARVVGRNFLFSNKILDKINIENLEIIGDNFLVWNTTLEQLNAPKAKHIGSNFMEKNRCLKAFSAPEVVTIEDSFLYSNENLETLDLENVTQVGSSFLGQNRIMTEINMPKVKRIGKFFLTMNSSLRVLNVNELQSIGIIFLPKIERFARKGPSELREQSVAKLTAKEALKNALRCGVTEDDIEKAKQLEKDKGEQIDDK